jgi:hypothetical protein
LKGFAFYPEKPLTRPDIIVRLRWLLGDRMARVFSECAGLPNALILDLACVMHSGNGWRHRMPENSTEEAALASWVNLLRLSDFQRLHRVIFAQPQEIARRLALAVVLFVDEHYRARVGRTGEPGEFTALSPLSLFFVENADVFEREPRRFAAFSILNVCAALPQRYIRLRLTTPEGLEESVVQKATHFPLGGYAELTTTGTLESIVPTELLTYSELPEYFDYKIVNGQMLYFARDTESEALILKRSVVLFAYLPLEMYQGIVDFNGIGNLPARIVQGTLYSLSLSLLPQTKGRFRLEWLLAGPEAEDEKEWLKRILATRVALSAVPDLKTPPREAATGHGKFVAALVMAPEEYSDAVEAYAAQNWDAYRTLWFSEGLIENPAVLYREAERALSLL